MPNCKTCRFWNRDIDGTGSTSDWGETWGICTRTSTQSTHRIEFDLDQVSFDHDSLARAQDAEGYSAWLETEQDFGCIQWEAKDGA